ncbi:MAG: hypothetical protein IPI58_06685 [Alphaproteobacteria bacterium]|nr:MAG: hypothetical protein IPI58_06685 [Alphaproteobacteria bacterium]
MVDALPTVLPPTIAAAPTTLPTMLAEMAVVSLPPAVQQALQAATRPLPLPAQVVSIPAQSLTQLLTSLGAIMGDLSRPLPPGTDSVLLRLSLDGQSAQIFAGNGQTLGKAALPPMLAENVTVPGTVPSIGIPRAGVNLSGVLLPIGWADVLGTNTPPAATSNISGSLAASPVMGEGAAALSLPISGNAAPPVIGQSVPGLPKAEGSPTLPGMPPSSGVTPTTPATAQAVRVILMPVPDANTAAPPMDGDGLPTVSGAAMTATYQGAALGGRAVLSLPGGGALVLDKALALKPGESVQVLLQTETAPATSAPRMGSADWPRLLAAAAASHPALASGLQARLPQMDSPQGPGSLLFLLSAVGGGRLPPWLSEDSLRQMGGSGPSAVLRDIEDAMRQMSSGQMMQEPSTGPWRQHSLPLQDAAGWSMMNLYVHRDPPHPEGEGGKDNANRPTRFVMEIELSALGRMQLDALSRPRQSLDLVVRSRDSLPDPLRADLHQTWTNTLEAMGLSGSLRFQGDGHGWLSWRRPAQPTPTARITA